MFSVKFRQVASGVAALMVIPLALPVTANAAPASWRVVDLGAGDHSIALAINDRGHVVGTRGNTEGFLWRDGRITELGSFQPTDINNRDEIVGYRWGETGTHATLWRRGATIDIGPPGVQTYPTAVNDRGEVVGLSSAGGDSPFRAFSWRDGVMTLFGNDYSHARDINDRGQVVGNGGGSAVRWWRGVETRLTSEPSQAEAVNRFGAVTGLLWGSSGAVGFVWQRGRFVELSAPPSDTNEFRFIQPSGLNDRTQVVGSSSAGAFLWERGRTTIMPRLASYATVATDINERGVITGYAPTTMDGLVPHAVIWRR